MNAWCIGGIVLYLFVFAFVWSLCIAASRADEAMERMMIEMRDER